MTEQSAFAALSKSEQRFDRRRRSIGLVLGPALAALILVWPMPELTTEAHRLAAVVCLVVIWWITEAIPIPITAMLGAALAVLFGVATPTEALAPFASPIIFLFIGSFILSRGIVANGVDGRIAAAVLSVPIVGSSRTATFAAVAALTLVVSAWISNMAATAMMLPVLLSIIGEEGATPVGESRRMLIGLAYIASIGGMITPVGAAPNLITIGFLDSLAGTRIDFLTWIAVTTPIALVMGAVLLAVVRFDVEQAPAPATAPVTAHGPWLPGQRNALIAFAVTVALWLVPGILNAVAPNASLTTFFDERVHESVAAIIGVALLFLLPVNRKRGDVTLTWKQAAQIDWGTILLMGGGFSLGSMMFETGLAEHIAQGIIDTSGTQSLWTLTAVATLLGMVLTEITSNTASASMLAPVVISICLAAGIDPIAPAIGACLGASLAFMLPISTPSNAIVYGTGRVPLGVMVRYGFLMNCVGFFVIQIGLWILVPLLFPS